MAPKILFPLCISIPLSEFAHPYAVLAPHTSITVASPKGGTALIDPNSLSQVIKDRISRDFLAKNKSLWGNTVRLSSLAAEAVLFVGGHGPMFDLATDSTSHTLIQDFHAKNKIIAAVCHGPSALANVVQEDERFLLEGLKVTDFADSEERRVGIEVPFSLGQMLGQASGGGFVKGDEWAPMVEIGTRERLITG
ncbi:hypothetical protein V502_11501 [Pseudogymnoascus sp. VKM F-4520 (FW-2644)]|nr:hypothetical protein V502_11501 [Pseudogymnoascus sp. VKM F-4520 (FW-2644)]